MIEKLDRSHDNVLGYKLIGTIGESDYEVLGADVTAAEAEHDSVLLLMDLTGFKWEKVTAWDDDWRFGRDHKESIVKLAIVGDKRWQKWLTKLADSVYAQEASFFDEAEADAAWAWLEA